MKSSELGQVVGWLDCEGQYPVGRKRQNSEHQMSHDPGRSPDSDGACSKTLFETAEALLRVRAYFEAFRAIPGMVRAGVEIPPAHHFDDRHMTERFGVFFDLPRVVGRVHQVIQARDSL